MQFILRPCQKKLILSIMISSGISKCFEKYVSFRIKNGNLSNDDKRTFLHFLIVRRIIFCKLVEKVGEHWTRRIPQANNCSLNNTTAAIKNEEVYIARSCIYPFWLTVLLYQILLQYKVKNNNDKTWNKQGKGYTLAKTFWYHMGSSIVGHPIIHRKSSKNLLVVVRRIIFIIRTCHKSW